MGQGDQNKDLLSRDYISEMHLCSATNCPQHCEDKSLTYSSLTRNFCFGPPYPFMKFGHGVILHPVVNAQSIPFIHTNRCHPLHLSCLCPSSQSKCPHLPLAATIPYLLSFIPQQIVTRHTIVLDLQHLNPTRIVGEICCHAVGICSQRRVWLGVLITYTSACVGRQMMLQVYGLTCFCVVCFIILHVIGTHCFFCKCQSSAISWYSCQNWQCSGPLQYFPVCRFIAFFFCGLYLCRFVSETLNLFRYITARHILRLQM
jgi:hypothetical protein